jgi:hypothetical protein
MSKKVTQFLTKPDAAKSSAPQVASFEQFLRDHARVPLKDGSFGPYTFDGREPLLWAVRLIDKVLSNTLDAKEVEIDGVTFKHGTLRKAYLALCGGAQFGKTILEQNLMAYLTGCRFKAAATYIPDQIVLEQIVDTKFRPQVVDQIPWFAEMFQAGKAQNSSGKTVHKKTCFQVSDGEKLGFGFYCGMHRPPTTISLDVAALDERDDIKVENVGFVAGRMTNSEIALHMDIGTQRIHGAGQNRVFDLGTQHVGHIACACGADHVVEDEFPKCIRMAMDGVPTPSDPILTADAGYDRDALYYLACTQCGAPLDAATVAYKARRPERVKQARFSQRISQLNIAAISINGIVASYFSAIADPDPNALVAFYCDVIAIPRATASQPLAPEVLDRARHIAPYHMILAPAENRQPTAESRCVRVAGADMGPRCWLWCDEIASPVESRLAWAEMIASGNFVERVTLLMEILGIQCIFMDAGGEPDLTKRAVLALNGLDSYSPPVMPRNDLVRSHLSNIGIGLTWDGARSRWTGLRAAAVAFVAGEARGIEQTVGHTIDGKIYPLINCHRGSAIQAAVNDFLTPTEGVLELVETAEYADKTVAESRDAGQPARAKTVRQLPRARLPLNAVGPGLSLETLDVHLQNLRKERDPHTGKEDWVGKVENHAGLAKVYAKIAATVAGPNLAAPSTGYEVCSTRRDRNAAHERSVLI